MNRHPAPASAPRDSRGGRLCLVLAFAIAILSAAGWIGVVVREARFFSQHTRQKTRLLELPAELQRTQEALVHEQRELQRLQGEIREQMKHGRDR